MAQNYVCDGCEDEPGVMLLTNLDNGDVKAIGGACLPTWLRSVADAIDGGGDNPDQPVPYTVTDSASPTYNPDSGELTKDPTRPDPAPPQPETDADARGTGDGTIDHGAAPATAPASEPASEPAPATDPDADTPAAPETSPASPEPDPTPAPDNAPAQALAGV